MMSHLPINEAQSHVIPNINYSVYLHIILIAPNLTTVQITPLIPVLFLNISQFALRSYQ